MVGKIGTIVSWTIVRVPPGGFASFAPYPVVLVDVGTDRMCLQLVDWHKEHLTVGQRVELVIRRIGEPQHDDVIPYGLKAKPIE